MYVSANQFAEVFKQLGYDIGELGCIMLDTEPLTVSDVIPADELYVPLDEDGNVDDDSYANGIVSESIPHVTLLYGLLRSGLELQSHVDAVLAEWSVESVTIAGVSFFESQDSDKPFYCIVAKLDLTPELVEGNARLRALPHIDTFPTYQPHITLAYIKKDDQVRDDVVYALNERFAGSQVRILGINYGD